MPIHPPSDPRSDTMQPTGQTDETQPTSTRSAGQNRSMPQPILSTARLTLVPLTDEHLDLEAELDADPEVMRYLTGRASTRAEAERAHQRRLASAHEVPGLGFWVGFDRENRFVGWWLLLPPHGPDQPKVAGEADLGYRLLRRHWRRGYATEGARELIRYGFQDVGLTRIFAQTLAVNTPSRATMTAAGLTFSRAFASGDPDDGAVPGTEHGEVEYEITRGGWQRHHASPGQRLQRQAWPVGVGEPGSGRLAPQRQGDRRQV